MQEDLQDPRAFATSVEVSAPALGSLELRWRVVPRPHSPAPCAPGRNEPQREPKFQGDRGSGAPR